MTGSHRGYLWQVPPASGSASGSATVVRVTILDRLHRRAALVMVPAKTVAGDLGPIRKGRELIDNAIESGDLLPNGQGSPADPTSAVYARRQAK